MAEGNKQILILGSGVIGLTSAYRLLEAGYSVTLVAQSLSPHTTSDVAAAFWSPSATGGDERTKGWAMESLHTFRAMTSNTETGIQIVDLYQLTTTPDVISYMNNAGTVTIVPEGRFPAPWSGYCVAVPRIDVPLYMPWLTEQVRQKGGQVQQYIIQRLGEISTDFPIIINCTGLGARLLTGDELFPVRGQVISVEKPPGISSDIIYANADHENTTYIIPRSRDCLLGGTYQYRDGNTEVDPQIADEIMERCAVFNPALRAAKVLQHKVGLRPGRAAVRLETEKRKSGQYIIHNYGHGSIGHTLSWGCAAEVVKHVEEIISLQAKQKD